MNVYHGIKALLKFDETTIKHTTGKNKLKILSGPILRDTEQSITKCHIEKCHFYNHLYNGQARLVYPPYK